LIFFSLQIELARLRGEPGLFIFNESGEWLGGWLKNKFEQKG
jgi:hypothetical protein